MLNDFIDFVPFVYFLSLFFVSSSSPPTHKTLHLRLPKWQSYCYAAFVSAPPWAPTNPCRHCHEQPIAIILILDHNLDPNSLPPPPCSAPSLTHYSNTWWSHHEPPKPCPNHYLYPPPITVTATMFYCDPQPSSHLLHSCYDCTVVFGDWWSRGRSKRHATQCGELSVLLC